MFVVKLRRGCVPPVLLEVFAGTLDVAYEDFSQLLVHMRANNDAQAGDLLRVGRHRISRQDSSSLPDLLKMSNCYNSKSKRFRKKKSVSGSE